MRAPQCIQRPCSPAAAHARRARAPRNATGTIALAHLRSVLVDGSYMRIMTAEQTMELTVNSADEAQVTDWRGFCFVS